MTKKLSLAALALVSTCYFTACDDDSSSVEASCDEPGSSASVTSSEDKADPESSAAAPKSSASEETPASSASEEKPVIKAACDIDINSDKWEFEAVGKFMETFDGSAKAVTVFEGSTATITLNVSAEIGEFCEMAKANLKEKIASEVENLGEQETVDVECNENGELIMSAVKIENNVTEESKKEIYAETVQVCKNAQDGKLDGLLDGSADEEKDEVKAACDIDKESDKWTFAVESEYEGMPAFAEGKAEYEEQKVFASLVATIKTESKAVCEQLKSEIAGDSDDSGMEYSDISSIACDDKGVLTIQAFDDTLEMDENEIAEYKKVAYENMTKVCQDIQNGNFEIFDI